METVKPFKIIAIRPLMDYGSKYLKNLKPKQVYQFYNGYTFEFEDDNTDKNVLRITDNNLDVYDDLYKIEYEEETITGPIKRNINISISAIVGKNGSGKSSLSELLLLSLFFISEKFGFVKKTDFLDPKNSQDNDRYGSDLKDIEDVLGVEIFYVISNQIYKLLISDGKIFISRSSIEGKEHSFTEIPTQTVVKSQLTPFFYSMIVNYSIYGFNSNDMGIWVRGVFHKNDGYQMPVVINPYKEAGNMNINIETYLTRARVLSNLISVTEYRFTLNPKSAVSFVEMYFDEDKDYADDNYQMKASVYRDIIIKPLFKEMFSDLVPYPKIDTPIAELAEAYLIHKLHVVIHKYKAFEEFENFLTVEGELADRFKKALFQNRTHITLKIFQTLNFIADHSYYNVPHAHLTTVLDLEAILAAIEDKRQYKWFTQPIEYLPPPFLVTRIVFKDKSTFDELSSGEKQKIYSLNSIVYHLSNLDSVTKHHVIEDENKPIVYKNINLILDEIELYYHPEFQRRFISELLAFLKNAKFKSIDNVNILFLTHSPFILSDIPKDNILFLDVKEEKVKNMNVNVVKKLATPQTDKKQTFAANIHELLTDGFFMESTQGEVALTKIYEIIDFCASVKNAENPFEFKISYQSKRDYFKNLTNIIGENYIRTVLQKNLEDVDLLLASDDDPEVLRQRLIDLEKETEEIKRKLQ